MSVLLVNQLQLRSELRNHRELHQEQLHQERALREEMQQDLRSLQAVASDLQMSDPEDGGPEVIYGTDENNNSVPMRRLSNIYSIGTAANSGCFAVSTAGTTTLDLTATNACTGRCPACFVKTGTNVVTLSLSNVGSAVWKSAAFSGIRTYLLVYLA